ncbi:MAG: putative cardiolipin synthase [Bacteriovoracaceae bacterium]|jgi:putative cardiolipin synthase
MRLLFILLLFATSYRALGARSPFYFKIDKPHKAQVLHSGIQALQVRLDLIEKAKSTIDLEAYILNKSKSSRLILQALSKKVKAGVRVRILYDGGNHIKYDDSDFALLSKTFDLKIFNLKKKIRPIKNLGRNHRKLLIVDGKKAILGGRNNSDYYFELGSSFNFVDREILIEGELPSKLVKNFEAFFYSKMAKRFKGKSSSFRGSDLLTEKAEDLKLKALVANESATKEVLMHTCDKVEFISDIPSRSVLLRRLIIPYRNRVKLINSFVAKKSLEAKKSIDIEQAYLIALSHTKRLIKKVLKKGVKINILTNSFLNNDTKLLNPILDKQLEKFSRHKNFNAYQMNGPYTDEYEDVLNPDSTWATHSKTIVFDEKSTIFGSYNLDSISRLNNTELIMLCHSKKVAKTVLDSIKLRSMKAWKIDPDSEFRSGEPLYDSLTQSERKLYKRLLIPLSLLKTFL